MRQATLGCIFCVFQIVLCTQNLFSFFLCLVDGYRVCTSFSSVYPCVNLWPICSCVWLQHCLACTSVLYRIWQVYLDLWNVAFFREIFCSYVYLYISFSCIFLFLVPMISCLHMHVELCMFFFFFVVPGYICILYEICVFFLFTTDVMFTHACVPMYVFTLASRQGRRGLV